MRRSITLGLRRVSAERAVVSLHSIAAKFNNNMNIKKTYI